MNGRKVRFDKRMQNFTEIRFTTDKFMRSLDVVVKADGENVEYLLRNVSGELRPFFDYGKKSEFLKDFEKLDVGKWKKRYEHKAGALEARKWELLIRFSDGGDVKFSGNNAYPSTFAALDKLLRIDYAI